MSRLDEYINVAREKGLNVGWRVNLIFATASLFGISPERIADDALDAMERKSCFPKSILGNSANRGNRT